MEDSYGRVKKTISISCCSFPGYFSVTCVLSQPPFIQMYCLLLETNTTMLHPFAVTRFTVLAFGFLCTIANIGKLMMSEPSKCDHIKLGSHSGFQPSCICSDSGCLLCSQLGLYSHGSASSSLLSGDRCVTAIDFFTVFCNCLSVSLSSCLPVCVLQCDQVQVLPISSVCITISRFSSSHASNLHPPLIVWMHADVDTVAK